MSLMLCSKAFGQNERIPFAYTCDGKNISPAFEWSGVPTGTVSFALICSDPDVPSGTWYHWAIYDILASQRMLPHGISRQARQVRQAENDFHLIGYDGPCPPRHGVHHYHFHLISLKVERLALKAGPGCRHVEVAARQNALESTELIGIYSR